MKKLFIFFILLGTFYTVQCQKTEFMKIWDLAVPFGDSLKKLALEGKNGFAGRKGKAIKGEAGEERFATKPLAWMGASDQYISVLDGKEFYIATFKDKKTREVLLQSIIIITGSNDYNHRKPGSLYFVNSSLGEPKDEWYDRRAVRESEDISTPMLFRYYSTKDERKNMLVIGPVEDYGLKYAAEQLAWKKKRLAGMIAEFKPSGDDELDAIVKAGWDEDKRGGGDIGRELEKIYTTKANQFYEGVIGKAYPVSEGKALFMSHDAGKNFGYFPKPATGNEVYHGPLWMGSNASFETFDTSGFGLMLYLFFDQNDPHTNQVLQAVRGHASRFKPTVMGQPGPGEFLYMDNGGQSTFRYRWDTTSTAGYKGLTIIFEQWYNLDKKMAAAERSRLQAESMNRAREEGNKRHVEVTAPGANCICCHGTGTEQVLTNNTYQRTDATGHAISGTTSYVQRTCHCCKGTGH